MKTHWLAMAAGLIVAGCGGGGNSTDPQTSAPSGESGNPLTAPVDYIGAVGRAKNTAQKTVDLANVTRAIQMFEAAEGRYPKDLQELVNQQYLPSLPAAPPGTRLVYDPARGQVSVVRQ